MDKFEFFLNECKLYDSNILLGYKLNAKTEEVSVYDNTQYTLHLTIRNDGTVTARVTEKNKTKAYETKLCATKFVEFMKPYA